MVATVSLKSRQIENPLIDLTAGLGDDLPLLDMTLSALPLLDFSWITSTAVPQQFMARCVRCVRVTVIIESRCGLSTFVANL